MSAQDRDSASVWLASAVHRGKKKAKDNDAHTVSLTVLILSALVFLSILFWVQSFLGFWQEFLREIPNEDVGDPFTRTVTRNPEVLMSFTIILTLVTAAFYFYYRATGHNEFIEEMHEGGIFSMERGV